MLVLCLQLRFALSAGVTAGVFFAAGLAGACSQLLAPVLAKRIGMVKTMAFTHMPASALLGLTAFAPNGNVAIGLLLVRAVFAQMDAPARQAFVMSVVPPEHRAPAASIRTCQEVSHQQPHRSLQGHCYLDRRSDGRY